MSNATDEIKKLEAEMIPAEMKPDPHYFERVLDDHALLDGKKMKSFVVEMHQPGKAPKFTRVEMSDYEYIDHGAAVVVSCSGAYEHASGVARLKFTRVWVRKADGWKIVAGSVAEAPAI